MKAVIPAAGLGTRLLPATKVIPKALWPVEGKPAIQWTLEEALHAGLTECVIIIGPESRLVREYLTPLPVSDPRKRHPAVVDLERLLSALRIRYVEQSDPRGLGHALLHLRPLTPEPAFALLLPDNVWTPGPGPIARLRQMYERYGDACVAVHDRFAPAPDEGFFTGEPLSEGLVRLTALHDAGADMEGRTQYVGIGRYVLPREALDDLEAAWSPDLPDLTEDAALRGLIARGRLLGLLCDPPDHHLGSGPKPALLASP